MVSAQVATEFVFNNMPKKKPFTKQHKENLSKAKQGKNHPFYGKKRPAFSQEWKDNIAKGQMGHPSYQTPEGNLKRKEFWRLKRERKNKQSQLMTKLWRNKEWREKTIKNISLGMQGVQNTLGKTWIRKPKYHGCWKGKKAKYITRHVFVNRARGKASSCEHCGKTEGYFEWQSTDHSYNRNPWHETWKMTCKECHIAHDKELGLKVIKELVGTGVDFTVSV